MVGVKILAKFSRVLERTRDETKRVRVAVCSFFLRDSLLVLVNYQPASALVAGESTTLTTELELSH